MVFGNVLVIGNSGVRKSTRINAVLGDDKAKTSAGTEGTTKELEIYTSTDKNVRFRIIDTIGFEPSFAKRHKAIGEVKKWSKRAAKDGDPDTNINIIWFCVDGTAKKLFPQSIASLAKATSLWESIPIVVVITKSYSQTERPENIEIVEKAFSGQKKQPSAIIPVVADKYVISETSVVPEDGIGELIDVTNRLLPEGKRAAEEDVATFKLKRKRAMAQGIIGTSSFRPRLTSIGT